MAFRKINISDVKTLTTEMADTKIVLNADNLSNVDIGFIGRLTSSIYTGLVRDSGTGKYHLFDGYTGVLTNTDIDVSDPSLIPAALQLGSLDVSNISSNSGDIVFSTSINLSASRIKNVATPVVPTDSATKGYVDNSISNISSNIPTTYTTTTTNTTPTTVFSFAHATSKSAKCVVSVSDGTDVTTADVVIATNGIVVSISVYGIVNTGSSVLASIDAVINGANVDVTTTALAATSTTTTMNVSLV